MFGSRQPHLNFRRSLEDFRLRQVDLALQFPPLRYSRWSSRKKVACAPPGMAIEDVPFKRAVRARMPPHVEEPLVHRPQSSSAPAAPPFDLGARVKREGPEEVVASPGPPRPGAHRVRGHPRRRTRPNNGFAGG